jgi:ELWxxDGT repeat protein
MFMNALLLLHKKATMPKSLLLVLLLLTFSTVFPQSIDATLIERNFANDSKPWDLTAIDNKIYFSAVTYPLGRELWVHDTQSGTTNLVKDIASGEANGLSGTSFVKVANQIFFTAHNNSYEGIWSTDGTEAGTHIVKEIWTSGYAHVTFLGVVNNKLIFSGSDGIHGIESWVSDGTADGTYMLKDIRTGEYGSDPANSYVINGELYFTTTSGPYQQWKTDGTPEGTVLADIQDMKGNVIEMNGNYYFYANQPATGTELWKSDGSAAGTQMVKDIFPGPSGSSPIFMAGRLNDRIVFVAADSIANSELWTTDGTSERTFLIKDFDPLGSGFLFLNEIAFVPHGGKLYFSAYTPEAGLELWKTDGTPSGTQMVKDIYEGIEPSSPRHLTSAGGFLLFSASAGAAPDNVTSLWKSDGTAEGTIQLVAEVISTDANMGFGIVGCNGSAYFSAGLGSENGLELWKSSGTPETTSLLFDVDHAGSAEPSFVFGAKAELNGNLVYFSNTALAGYQPFISDGTGPGTHLIKELGTTSVLAFDSFEPVPLITKAGNNIYFRGFQPETGYEIYKTDGTAAGTALVKDIVPGTGSSVSYTMFMSYNSLFFFVADDGVHGAEVWRTDGTEAGTFMLKDINVGMSIGSYPQTNSYQGTPGYAIMNGFLYFTAFNGTQANVYKTDGTTLGTQLAFTPYSAGQSYWRPRIIGTLDSRILYLKNDDAAGNYSLWSSDGTAPGTLLGSYDALSPQLFENCAVYNNELYFNAFVNNLGHCLIKTNGTAAGTSIVKSGLQLVLRMNNMTVCGDFLYFSLGDYGGYDEQVWRTDGTSAGTIQLDGSDISGYSSFTHYTCVGQTLAYLATNEGNFFHLTTGYPGATELKEIEVLNGDNFGPYSSIYGIGGVVNGKILFAGRTDASGVELYASAAGTLLSIGEHEIDVVGRRMRVYPNPSDGKITVRSSVGAIISAVEIYDFTGKKIIASDVSSVAAELDLTGLNPGMYFLKILSDGHTETSKIIIY